jgi:hypothetical protein
MPPAALAACLTRFRQLNIRKARRMPLAHTAEPVGLNEMLKPTRGHPVPQSCLQPDCHVRTPVHRRRSCANPLVAEDVIGMCKVRRPCRHDQRRLRGPSSPPVIDDPQRRLGPAAGNTETALTIGGLNVELTISPACTGIWRNAAGPFRHGYWPKVLHRFDTRFISRIPCGSVASTDTRRVVRDRESRDHAAADRWDPGCHAA